MDEIRAHWPNVRRTVSPSARFLFYEILFAFIRNGAKNEGWVTVTNVIALEQINSSDVVNLIAYLHTRTLSHGRARYWLPIVKK